MDEFLQQRAVTSRLYCSQTKAFHLMHRVQFIPLYELPKRLCRRMIIILINGLLILNKWFGVRDLTEFFISAHRL